MKLRISKYLFLLMMAVFALSSCSEDDNTVDEYANWQARNEKAFADTLAYARQQIANGSDEWKVILKWSHLRQGYSSGNYQFGKWLDRWFYHSHARYAHRRPLAGVYPIPAGLWYYPEWHNPCLFHASLRDCA